MKYSDVPMLSRNDSIILGQQVDVAKALDLLTMCWRPAERMELRSVSLYCRVAEQD